LDTLCPEPRHTTNSNLPQNPAPVAEAEDSTINLTGIFPEMHRKFHRNKTSVTVCSVCNIGFLNGKLIFMQHPKRIDR